jgi:glycosyltransferase involved in cell wall biosynthesis
MRIWILKDGETLPIDGKDANRLLRAGLIADELVKRNHKVVWWTSSFSHFKKEFRTNCDEGVKIIPNYLIRQLHGPGYQKNISLKRIFHNRIIAKKFLQAAEKEERPDVIFAALPTTELALAATQYGQQYNVPVILDLRDMWPDILLDVAPKILRPLARVALSWQFNIVQKACKSATGLVGITSMFLKWGLGYAARDKNKFDAIYPIAYIDNKPDAKSLVEARSFFEQLGIFKKNKEIIISYVGSLNMTYRIDWLIDAIKKMDKSIKLVICGSGPLLSGYKKQAQDYSNIIFTGWIDKSKIWHLLRVSNLGVSPHNKRADAKLLLTNKVAEYLSAGLPVLTNLPKNGETGKLLLKNKCGFCFNFNDPTNLVKILVKIKNDTKLLKNMSKNARALYEREFIAKKVYGELCDHLESVLNSCNICV